MPQNPLSIAVVGDVIPVTPLFPGGKPLTEGFASVVELIAGADLAVGNLDTTLTTRGYPREKLINVRANPEIVAPDLARMGFDVISVANNHGTDYGETGLFERRNVGLRRGSEWRFALGVGVVTTSES